MKFYVDSGYYINEFKGSKITDKEVEKYLKLSQEKIDSITYNRIVKIGFDNLTEFQQEKVKDAMCYQAEYIFENGFNNEDNNDISSYSVLDINITVKDTKNTKAKQENMSEIAYDLIHKTGLDCRIL